MTTRFAKFAAAALAAAALAGAVQSAWARTAEEVRAVCRAEGRPCVGLVLSGGGARGFAHDGVLKVLEELGVKVDVVTGTSMGSMIGGAYAAGYSADQIEDIISGVNWNKMMASRAERKDLPWRLKKDDYKNLPSNGIEFTKDWQVKMPDSVIPTEELDLFLADKTGPVNYVNDLSDLALPFACVATDLVTGKPVVMQKDVDLGHAMRSSMSVPGVFAPVTWKEHVLVDGGLVDNIPIELARKMGADVIIAVNVGTPLLKRDQIGNIVSVMAQMVNLLTEQNVQRSLATLKLKEGDILITPELDEYTSADFSRSAAIIKKGIEAANRHRGELSRYAVPRNQWVRWEAVREKAVLPATRREEHQLAAVKVEGLKVVNPEAVLNEIDIDTSKPVTNDEIENASRRVWADGEYSSVRYRFEPGPEGTETLVLEPKEKKPGYSSIRVGGSLETDFKENHTFNVILSHSFNWINSWGGEQRTDLLIGHKKHLTLEWYQPLGPGSDIFFDAKAGYRRDPFDVYHNNDIVARFRNQTYYAEAGLGWSIARQGYAELAGGYATQHTNRAIGTIDPTQPSVSSPFVSGRLFLDTLDNVNFPRKGYYVSLELSRYADVDSDFSGNNVYEATVQLPYSIDRWSAMLTAKAGQSAMPNYFSLGGAFELSGSPYGRYTGSHLQFASLRLSRDVSDLFGNSPQPIWLGASFEAGRAWNKHGDVGEESSDNDWHEAIGGYIGLDSVIGPVYLMTGRTFDESWGFYFFWGRKL
ncbi:MAG: PNPLA domain-containing protein [Burkholderia sp.]|jgi:NTE family protein